MSVSQYLDDDRSSIPPSEGISEIELHVEAVSSSEETVVELSPLPGIPQQEQSIVAWEKLRCYAPGPKPQRNYVQEACKYVRQVVTCAEEEMAAPPPKKQILYSLNGRATAGEITAFMGPPSSGKTTILSILACRTKKPITYIGKVSYNGMEANASLRRMIGYISEEDLLFDNLTVYETLYFAALLKLPQTMTCIMKRERIEAVISTLALEKCRDSLIHDRGGHTLTKSEKKRISIGQELLLNPPVLILDEPTIGLHASAATSLMSTLQTLALGGRLVVIAVHQLSTRAIQTVGKLVLLSEGRAMYYGSSQHAKEWFDQQGFEVPEGMHIADFILELANGDIEGQQLNKESAKLYLIQRMNEFLKLHPEGLTEIEFSPRASTNRAPTQDAAMKRERPFLKVIETSKELCVSMGIQIFALSVRSLKSRLVAAVHYQYLLQSCAAAVFTMLMWWNAGDGDTLLVAYEISAVTFFILLYMQCDLLMRGLYAFPPLIAHMNKENTNGMYSIDTFYISETLCDLLFDSILSLLYLTITYWGIHLRCTLTAFSGTVCTVILSTLNIQSIGILIGINTTNSHTAHTLVMLFALALILTPGFFVRSVPDWMEWLKYLFPSYWAYTLILQIQFGGKSYYDCGGITKDQVSIEDCALVEDLTARLNLPVDVDGNKAIEILVLFGLFFFLRFTIYCNLKAPNASNPVKLGMKKLRDIDCEACFLHCLSRCRRE